MNKATAAARKKWSRIIERQRRSGLSVVRYCEERAIPASSLFSWRRKLGNLAQDGAAPSAAGFVEARLMGREGAGAPARESGVAIELAGGRRVTVEPGFDPRLLLEVIGVLESGTPVTVAGGAPA